MKLLEYGIEQTNALFLLLLVLMGGFVIETLNCDIQYILTHNRLLKSLIVLLSIYISLIITDKKPKNPLINFRNSFLIWVFFILFTKTNGFFTIIIISLLICIFILNNYLDYYKDKYGKTNYKIIDIQKVLFIIVIIILIMGNIHYYSIKQQKYGINFNLLKYIFGIEKCHKLQN